MDGGKGCDRKVHLKHAHLIKENLSLHSSDPLATFWVGCCLSIQDAQKYGLEPRIVTAMEAGREFLQMVLARLIPPVEARGSPEFEFPGSALLHLGSFPKEKELN